MVSGDTNHNKETTKQAIITNNEQNTNIISDLK